MSVYLGGSHLSERCIKPNRQMSPSQTVLRLWQKVGSAHGPEESLVCAAYPVAPKQVQGHHCVQQWLTSAARAAAVGLAGRQVSKGGLP